jgi:putative ABC transport system permease protein
MKIQRLVRHGFRNMGRHRLRSFFMMLGTLVGVAALVVVIALGQGTQQQILDNVGRLFSGSSVLLTAGGGGMMGGPRSAGPTTTLTVADLEEIEATVPGIDVWDPQLMIGSREVVFEGGTDDARIMGQSHNAERVWNRGVSRGSFIQRQDVQTSARVALIGETTAQELFGDLDPIGQQIRIGTVPFEVVGVLELTGTDPHGWDRDDEIVVPITTMMRRLMNVDYIQNAKLLVRDGYDLEATVSSIEGLLRERHALADDEPNDFHMITPVQVEEMIQSMNRVFTVFLPLLAAVSIVVGGIVVANLMLMSVNERKSEIGLRKAVGARSRDVQIQFLLESALVTVTGGILALVLGFLILLGVARTMGTPVSMPWEAAVIGMLAATAVGLAAGVLPARRAAELDPVETLR